MHALEHHGQTLRNGSSRQFESKPSPPVLGKSGESHLFNHLKMFFVNSEYLFCAVSSVSKILFLYFRPWLFKDRVTLFSGNVAIQPIHFIRWISDFSNAQSYPFFEQLEPGVQREGLNGERVSNRPWDWAGNNSTNRKTISYPISRSEKTLRYNEICRRCRISRRKDDCLTTLQETETTLKEKFSSTYDFKQISLLQTHGIFPRLN